MASRMRTRIISGSTELFTRMGYSKVTMEELAEHMGISKKTIYNHFDTKEALFDEVLSLSNRRIARELGDIAENDSLPLPEKFNKVLEQAYREIGTKDSAFFKDLNRYNEGLNNRPIELLRESTRKVITALLRQSQEEGIVTRELSVQRLAGVFQNIIEGVTSGKYGEKNQISRVQLLKDSVKITLDGILTPRGREILSESVLNSLKDEQL